MGKFKDYKDRMKIVSEKETKTSHGIKDYYMGLGVILSFFIFVGILMFNKLPEYNAYTLGLLIGLTVVFTYSTLQEIKKEKI